MERPSNFLFQEIPPDAAERLNLEYDLDLKPGDTFLDALNQRAVRLARTSPEWAETVRAFGLESGKDE